MSDLLTMLAPDGGGPVDGAAGVPAWLPWALVGAGIVLLAGVVVLLVRGREAAGARSGAAAELADLRHSLVEVKKLAATVADDLDRRAERLEKLIAKADEVLERGVDGRSEEPSPTAGSGFARSGRQATGAPSAVDDLALRVFALADQGRTAQEIAQALRQPIGNVELMLALRGDR